MNPADLIARYYAAFNAKDWDGMLACVSDNLSHDVNEGGRHGGKGKFAAFIAHMDECYD
ncbi:MAG: nuclear transport factor 2 family protein [Hyphomonas sp.]